VLVVGFVVVLVRVHGAVVVRVRVLVLGLFVVLVLVLVVVVDVTVVVRVLDTVGMPVGMPVLLSHGARFGPRTATALPGRRAPRRPVSIKRRARPV
jgi:hypothetical protein